MLDGFESSDPKSSPETLIEGEAFLLLQTPDLKSAGEALLDGRHETWEVVYLDVDDILKTTFMSVDSMLRIDEPDGIERFVVSGTKFPGGSRISARFELEIPLDEGNIPHVSFVTFFED